MINSKIALFSILIAILIMLCLPDHAHAVVHICPDSHTNNQDGTCTAEISDVIEDGYVSSSARTSDAEMFRILEEFIDYLYGYVEWDISTIPDAATVNEAHFVSDVTYVALIGEVGITRLESHRPTTTSTNDLWSYLYSSPGKEENFYAQDIPFIVEDAFEVDLGTAGASSVESQLASDWFAIGVANSCMDPFCTTAGQVRFNSSEAPSGNPPTLKINYDAESLFQIDELDDSLTVTDSEGNDIAVGSTDGVTGSQNVYLFDAGENLLIAEFDGVSFTNDLIWDNITAGIDTDEYTSYIHISGPLDSQTGPFTLYAPRGENHDTVRICPQASSLEEIAKNCSGEIEMKDGESKDGMTAESIVLAGHDIWRIDGVMGTGAASFKAETEELADTGDGIRLYLCPVIFAAVIALLSTTGISHRIFGGTGF